jgi:hypothetical protein
MQQPSAHHDAWGVLDADGRVDPNTPALIALGTSSEALRALHARLLCADLTVLGSRTIEMTSAHISLFTVAERIGSRLGFSAGTAVRPSPATATVAAVYDALLARWDGSVLRGGATRLVLEGTCRGAMVVDADGTHSYGVLDGMSPMVQFRDATEPGDQLAVGTPAGDFRAFSAGKASVVLALGSTRGGVPRTEQWLDDLDAALA